MKKMTVCLIAFALMVIGSNAVFAQNQKASPERGTPPTSAPTLPPAAVVLPPLPLPLIDPANEIKSAALIEALRKGGFVLYMRHAETGVVTEKCEQSNLSVVGEENSRQVGAALRELNIPIGAVRSSEPCRCGDTARLLGLGAVDITEDLNPVAPRPGFDLGAARQKRLREIPATGTNTVLVSHLHGSIKKEEWLHLEMAEVIVFRPDGIARAEAVARIRVAGWLALRKAMTVPAAQ